MLIRIILFWLPMIAIAFANAALREAVLMKYMTAFRAHQWSTLTLIALCAVYTLAVFPYLRIESATMALKTGIVWAVMTVAFEFAIGLLTKKSWKYMLENYNLAEGKLWPVFLLCLMLMPMLYYFMKASRQ